MVIADRYPSILDTLMKYAPREMRNSSNPRSRYWIRCCIPGHDDKDPSMSISEDGSVATCWSKCGHFTRKTFLQAMNGCTDDDWRPVAPIVVKQPMQKPKANKASKKAAGCTLEQLAEAKGFTIPQLKALGWEDAFYPGSKIKSVLIPYWDQNKQTSIPRFRVNLTGNPKYWWVKGANLQPYGLWELPRARELGYIVIVEGETDWVTLNNLGIPALGIPGSQTWKPIWSHYLANIDKVYVWNEPGNRNEQTGMTAGEAMAHSIAPSVFDGRMFTVKPPDGTKDPTDIATQYQGEALAILEQLLAKAQSFTLPKEKKESVPNAQVKAPDTDSGSESRESDTLPTTKYISDDEGNPDHGHDFHWDWEACRSCAEVHIRRRQWAADNGRVDSMTGEVASHRDLLLKLLRRRGYDNAEFLTGMYGEKLCILMENPHLFIDKDWLELLLEQAVGATDDEGNLTPIVKQLKECGLPCKWSCVTDGTRFTGHIKCRCHFCQYCPTEVGRKLSRLRLPNLDADTGQRYCETWLYTEHQIPENINQWTYIFSQLMSTWEKEVAKLGRRVAYKGKVYFRSLGVYYTGNVARIHWKIMIYEEKENEADPAIEYLCRVMGAEIDGQRRYISGESAVMQIVEDTMSHLVGIDKRLSEEIQVQLFAAHYFATKGRHIFQGLGALHGALRKLPKPDPLVCDVCGGSLIQIIDRQDAPDSGHTSPTSPNYAWKDIA